MVPIYAPDDRRRLQGRLELHTSQAERLKPITTMLIDATQFFRTFADGSVMAWRDQHIIPRYNRPA